MNRKTQILILGILILSNCKQKGEIEYSFDDVQVNKSEYYLTLPIGIKKNEVNTYEDGFYQHFIYPDNSYVIILRGGNAELNVPKNDNPEMHFRAQSVDRIQMIYGNVQTERKAEFDKAFDIMKQKGLKRK